MEYPKQFPTHRHSREFWEELGRSVATFGFLEHALFQACFLFTGNKVYPVATHSVEEMKEKVREWESEVEGSIGSTMVVDHKI